MPTRPARHRHRARGRLGTFLGSGPGRAVAALAVLAVLTAVAVLLVGRDRPDGTPADGADAASSGASTDPALADLLSWADRELPVDARLRADPGVRAGLLAAGAPEELMAPAGPDDAVLAVAADGEEPDGRVVARFGNLAVVDPSPGVPTPEQLDRRRALADAVLANPTMRAPEDAAAVLRSGDVDMRLLSLLAALVARQGVQVATFPASEGAEGPARSMLLGAVGGEPLGTGRPGTEALQTWLEAQLPPYAPDRVEATEDGVLLTYRYASDPDALVAEVSP